MVVMEGERQSQAAGAGGGWYTEQTAPSAPHPASPMPAQHHQVMARLSLTSSLNETFQDGSGGAESDNYFKASSTASQYFMQSAYGGIQSHGEYTPLTL